MSTLSMKYLRSSDIAAYRERRDVRQRNYHMTADRPVEASAADRPVKPILRYGSRIGRFL